MNAKVYRFPQNIKSIIYKIPLYTDEDIFLTVLAINTFGTVSQKVTPANLEECDSEIVIAAITYAADCNIFSAETQQIYRNIIKSVETIEK
jgi:hypothetical protein